MHKFRNLFLLGAAIAVTTAGVAVAQDRLHSMTVRLPDGSFETIHYAGQEAPAVSFARQAQPVAMPSFDADAFGPSFADLERVSAAMEQQEAEMLQAFDADGGPFSVDFSNMPAGTNGYSAVSVISGGQACTQSIRYFTGSNGKPEVQQASSGDCSAVAGPSHATHVRAPAMQHAAPAEAPNGLLDIRYQAPPQAATKASTTARSF